MIMYYLCVNLYLVPCSDTFTYKLSFVHFAIFDVCIYVCMFVLIYIYSQTLVKHHPNIISETFFVYKFLQKNNQFVILC